MTVLAIVGVWFLCLALYVLLQARRPRYRYPSPPARVSGVDWSRAAA